MSDAMTKITTDAQALAVLDSVIQRSGHIVASDVVHARTYLTARLASTSPAPDGSAGCDYVPGRLDGEAPARVWLQIDTSGDNNERDEPWPGADVVTWQDESIGGLEIQYVRADLAAPQPVVENENG